MLEFSQVIEIFLTFILLYLILFILLLDLWIFRGLRQFWGTLFIKLIKLIQIVLF